MNQSAFYLIFWYKCFYYKQSNILCTQACYLWLDNFKKNYIASKKEKVSVKLYREYCEYFKYPFFGNTSVSYKKYLCYPKFKFSPKFNDLANVSPSLEAFNYIKICSSKSTYFFFVKGVWGSFRLLRAPRLSVFIRVHFALLTWNFT